MEKKSPFVRKSKRSKATKTAKPKRAKTTKTAKSKRSKTPQPKSQYQDDEDWVCCDGDSDDDTAVGLGLACNLDWDGDVERTEFRLPPEWTNDTRTR